MSALAGICQSDGTCACRTGYALNATTGRCGGLVVVPDASVGGDTAFDAADAPVAKDAADAPIAKDVADAPIAKDLADAALAKDAAFACTPGANPTCNDNVSVSSLSGTCQSNGTCLCNAGFVINPNSGRCMVPAAGACSGSYEACGCGCCGSTPSPLCYYPSAGDSLSAIIAADQTVAGSSTCSLVGCALGQYYLCCAEASAEPAGSAQYTAQYTVGGYDRVGLSKTLTDGNCLSLTLVNSGPSGANPTKLRVSTPSNWTIEGAISVSACGSSQPGTQAIGAQGTVSFSPSGTASCAISAHLTVFFVATTDSPVTTMRIDADTVLISGGPVGYCR